MPSTNQRQFQVLRFIVLGAAALWGLGNSSYAQDRQAELDARASLPFDTVPLQATTPFGGVSIAPTHIVIDRSNPAGRINIFNTGDRPVRLRIDAIDMSVDERRNYTPIEGDVTPDWSAKPFIRYAPRQSTLAPGERQLLRVISRSEAGLEPQEYRSHLAITVLPLEQPKQTKVADQTNSDIQTVSASMDLRYRIIVPVIFRDGEAASHTRVQNARLLSQDKQQLVVTLERDGPHGTYGILEALSAAGDVVAQAGGIAVLVPNRLREVVLRLPEGSPAVAKVRFSKQTSNGEAGEEISSLSLE